MRIAPSKTYFLDSGVISVVAVYEDGSIIEMATIGREGCTGFQAVFGAKESSVRFLVQIPGSAAKMSRASFSRTMASMPSFRNLMYAYVHAFLEQVLVSAACNGAHSLRERLARWLLMMRDRSDDDALATLHATATADEMCSLRPPSAHRPLSDKFQSPALIGKPRGWRHERASSWN